MKKRAEERGERVFALLHHVVAREHLRLGQMLAREARKAVKIVLCVLLAFRFGRVFWSLDCARLEAIGESRQNRAVFEKVDELSTRHRAERR